MDHPLACVALDCELLSTASFSPEYSVEGPNASIPNQNEAATLSTIEPTCLRVTLDPSSVALPFLTLGSHHRKGSVMFIYGIV